MSSIFIVNFGRVIGSVRTVGLEPLYGLRRPTSASCQSVPTSSLSGETPFRVLLVGREVGPKILTGLALKRIMKDC
ncbi:unnamed protein product [Cochlearia groenlandica]